MIYVLRSYGTTVATVTPTSDWGVVPETYEVKVATFSTVRVSWRLLPPMVALSGLRVSRLSMTVACGFPTCFGTSDRFSGVSQGTP